MKKFEIFSLLLNGQDCLTFYWIRPTRKTAVVPAHLAFKNGLSPRTLEFCRTKMKSLYTFTFTIFLSWFIVRNYTITNILRSGKSIWVNSETHALQKYEQNGLLFLHPNRCVASYLKLLAQNCDFSTTNSLQINLSRKKAGVSHLPFDVTCLDKEVKL